MKKIIYILLNIIFLLSLSCKKENKSEVVQLNQQKIIEDDCHKALTNLIINSNFKTPFTQNINCLIDSKENEKLTVKLFVESPNGENRETTIGWVIINLKTKELLDITNDIDNPVILKYNNSDWNSFTKCYKKPNTSNTMNTEKIEFYQLFNDGSTIEFSPNDLQDDKPEIKDFKNKLETYIKEHPSNEDFDNEYLLKLINNNTFFDSQHYVNSLWLEYFIIKYNIDVLNLNELMSLAISQEDFNAIKILIKRGYITSLNELNKIKETKEFIKSKIEQDKNEPFESYLKDESKIKEIEALITKKYLSNYIQDPDGYTNLRKEKSTTSEILQKVNAGEKIEVIDNSSDWFLVQTKEGKKGYVHKSRIKSE